MNIYISLNALEETILGENSKLYQILKKLPGCSIVFVDISEEELYIKMTAAHEKVETNVETDADYSLLFYILLYRFSKDYDVTFESGANIIAEICKDNEAVLKDPNAIYILDISDDDAQCIQDQYGVICKNSINSDLDFMFSEHRTVCCVKDEPGDWKSSMFDVVTTGPLNSIIVSDRYLFSDNVALTMDKGAPSFKEGNGFKNLISILDGILPREERKTNIMVLIFCDAFIFKNNPLKDKKIDDSAHKEVEKCHFKFLSNRLNKEIKELRRGKYVVDVELLSFGRYAPYYDDTHNRRVLTNYSELFAEHKLAAFENGRSVVSQNITFNTLFSDGIFNKSDIPITSHQRKKSEFRIIIEDGREHKENCLYSLNGNSNTAEISEVRNLMIRPYLSQK